MSQYNRIFEKSFLATANFDTTTADHAAVYLTASQTINVRATVTSTPIGILQNGGVGWVLSSGMARVLILGTSKLQFNDSIAAVAPFRVNTLGLGIPLNNATVTTGNQFIGGISLEALTGTTITGAMAEVLWAPFHAARNDSATAI